MLAWRARPGPEIDRCQRIFTIRCRPACHRNRTLLKCLTDGSFAMVCSPSCKPASFTAVRKPVCSAVHAGDMDGHGERFAVGGVLKRTAICFSWISSLDSMLDSTCRRVAFRAPGNAGHQCPELVSCETAAPTPLFPAPDSNFAARLKTAHQKRRRLVPLGVGYVPIRA
jgi:hypothetical protein